MKDGGSGDCRYALLQLADEDNVAVAVRDLEPGAQRVSSGAVVVVREPLSLGHKVALRDLGTGETVLRCGMAIGSTTAPVAAGAWVHTHNLASDYIETFAHRGGER